MTLRQKRSSRPFTVLSYIHICSKFSLDVKSSELIEVRLAPIVLSPVPDVVLFCSNARYNRPEPRNTYSNQTPPKFRRNTLAVCTVLLHHTIAA